MDEVKWFSWEIYGACSKCNNQTKIHRVHISCSQLIQFDIPAQCTCLHARFQLPTVSHDNGGLEKLCRWLEKYTQIYQVRRVLFWKALSHLHKNIWDNQGSHVDELLRLRELKVKDQGHSKIKYVQMCCI